MPMELMVVNGSLYNPFSCVTPLAAFCDELSKRRYPEQQGSELTVLPMSKLCGVNSLMIAGLNMELSVDCGRLGAETFWLDKLYVASAAADLLPTPRGVNGAAFAA